MEIEIRKKRSSPMTKQYHLPFLMTSFIPCSSAAVIPYPITKMKMNFMSLQRSVNAPKNQRFPSGNCVLKAASTTPIHRLGTETINLNYHLHQIKFNVPKKSLTGWPNQNLTALTNFSSEGVRQPKKLKQQNTWTALLQGLLRHKKVSS